MAGHLNAHCTCMYIEHVPDIRIMKFPLGFATYEKKNKNKKNIKNVFNFLLLYMYTVSNCTKLCLIADTENIYKCIVLHFYTKCQSWTDTFPWK